MSLSNCHNIRDLRKLAKSKVPAAVFDYCDGAAGDELTKKSSIESFYRYQLLPHMLQSYPKISTQVKIMGETLGVPLFMSPTAIGRFFHQDGEHALASGAAKYQSQAVLSSISSTSIKDYREQNQSQRWYQLYILKDRGLTKHMMDQGQEHGIQSLVLTVDTPVGGRREKDLLHGMSIPPKLSISSVLEAGMHPNWWVPYLANKPLKFENIEGAAGVKQDNFFSMATYMNHQFDPDISWADAEKCRADWKGSFSVKGIVTVQDAKKAIDIGADCLIISTHGGRQMDGIPSAIEVIQQIRQAVGKDVQLIADGGIRRGIDIIKALALGADACSTGRPFLYGLCANGSAGVEKAWDLLIAEMLLGLKLMGIGSLDQVTQDRIKEIQPLSIPTFQY